MRIFGFTIATLSAAATVFILFHHRQSTPNFNETSMAVDAALRIEPQITPEPTPAPTPLQTSTPKVLITSPTAVPIAVAMNVSGRRISIPVSQAVKPDPASVHAFTVEDGIAVIDGDIALGVPSNSAREGLASLPKIAFWPSHKIPYFIQPSLESPGRVRDALQFFKSTAIEFVEYTGQDDVLVFQSGTGSCKSYVGRTGGNQPIWVAMNCGPHEIAHEIMHALGFTHEQNRADRDEYVRVLNENIDQTKLVNFQKMSLEFMQLNGLSEFSFDSIMIYPPSMFSANGRVTMETVSSSDRIAPSQYLSDKDVSRINKFYGSK